MKTEQQPKQHDKGTKNIIQKKEKSSFVKPVGDTTKFSPPSISGKQNKSLPSKLQSNMESSFGHDFSNVGIHTNSQKAVQMNARAFTQNEQVHFAPGEFNPNSAGGQNLIGHEFTHIAQQRAGVVKPTKMLKKGVMVNDDKSLENEADTLGKKAVRGEAVSKYRSAGLGVRNSMRTSQMMSNVIQRDIVDTGNLGYGEWDLNLIKNDATAAGGKAEERGTLKFTPSKYSPTSNDIRLIQIVRTVDTATGSNYKWTGGESDRNNVMTTADSANNVAGGFFVDHKAASVSPRTSKSDATITPDYRSFWPNSGSSQNGHKKSTTDIQHASLWDAPGANFPIKFNFVTSAKAMDTGRYYGTVLWGFEIYNDKKGISKIKNEYHRFREYRGQTFDAALQAFDDFYKNPGTTGAPTK
ncbi:uncharacterized protein DUF4157 [Kordia periserrulae]|uniref:Uncharacterized protein DUF4157 n=1 Tax=Kordia periserrulae TaxID=701523 RepID=A0A2T6BZW2_9FLAO|nr:DUF4157 domain-containing protein [Kordia periserrulae]PTX61611.1 uncharacterized protein DUF4157 [Kordia periserrulae]